MIALSDLRAFSEGGFVALAMLTPCPAIAGSFDDGQAAFEGRDFTQAESLWLVGAKAGDAASQLALGQHYEYGDGFHQDYSAAAKWFAAAAKQGDREASRDLGLLYLYGNGVPQDDTEFSKLYAAGLDSNAPADWWLKLDSSSSSVTLLFADADPKGGENFDEYIVASLSCDKTKTFSVDIISDPRNAFILRKVAIESTLYPKAVFSIGSGTYPAKLNGFSVGPNDMNGDWDVTYNLTTDGVDLAQSLYTAFSNGEKTFGFSFELQQFDLSPRSGDKTLLLSFLKKCMIL